METNLLSNDAGEEAAAVTRISARWRATRARTARGWYSRIYHSACQRLEDIRVATVARGAEDVFRDVARFQEVATVARGAGYDFRDVAGFQEVMERLARFLEDTEVSQGLLAQHAQRQEQQPERQLRQPLAQQQTQQQSGDGCCNPWRSRGATGAGRRGWG